MRNLLRVFLHALYLSVFFTQSAFSQTYGMNIPSGHPRLWFNAERLARAQQWYQANPFTPSASHPVDNALAGLLSGQASYCRTAINWMLGITIPDGQLNGTSSNDARWNGEQVYLVWDWCYQHMSSTERQTVMDRWNNYNNILRQKSWGGPGMCANNYHWGYLRNELAWAITSSGENSMANTFFQDALVTRWQNGWTWRRRNGRLTVRPLSLCVSSRAFPVCRASWASDLQ
jgi:hypothetical protein